MPPAKELTASPDSQANLEFYGFPQAGFDFLRALKKHNDRDWFRERKQIFEETVKQPMEVLVHEVAARCRRRGLALYAKDKNPLTRIYRDIRFSADKRPFNTHLGAGLRRSPAGNDPGEIYIHISCETPLVAAGFWMPERPFLQLWRESIVADPGAMKRMVKQLAKYELPLSSEHRLSRLPRGFDQYAGSDIADFLRLTSYVTSRNLTESDCLSAALVDNIVEFALAAKPLLEYGWKLGYTPQRDILAER
ncbi:MAG TPA: TIGR02453 family protein [Bryobacteraceae bacterium]|jgi:uncharacterized protein (TIGR02453 family)|nr:TIGR02453 family protein [Bryobacteraceae bacterium]